METANCRGEVVRSVGAALGREKRGEVVLVGRLKAALRRLDKEMPEDAVRLAVENLVTLMSASCATTLTLWIDVFGIKRAVKVAGPPVVVTSLG